MNARSTETTGKRIRDLYEVAGYNQRTLAKKLSTIGVDITNSHISGLVKNVRTPSAQVLVGLAQVLNTTTDYLLCLTDNSERPALTATGELVLNADQLVYEAADATERWLTQRMLKMWDQLTDGERTVLIDLAEALRNLRLAPAPSESENK